MSLSPKTCCGNGRCGKADRGATRRYRRPRVHVEFVRVPGLYRRWEVEDLLGAGDEIRVEPCGAMDDGTPLHMVFRREGGGP